MIALIPARSGSKRIPDKNIRYLCGTPLLAYPVIAAVESGIFDDVYVSSDSPDYIEIASQYGARGILRGTESSDDATDTEWITEALSIVGYQEFAILRPTNPFITVDTLLQLNTIFRSNRDTKEVRTFRKCSEHPYKMWNLRGLEASPVFSGNNFRLPTQSLPEFHVQAAGAEFRRILDNNYILGLEVSFEEGFDLNTEYDWIVAEHIARSGKVKLPRRYDH